MPGMTLTQEELALIRESLVALKPGYQTHSVTFYEKLFAQAPQLRSMFREDLAGQGMKFMTTLGVIVDKLHHESAVAEQYVGLGRKHASLGVEAAHFEPMREALLDTLRAAMGAEFTLEMEQAWRRGFDQVGANMMTRGGIAPG